MIGQGTPHRLAPFAARPIRLARCDRRCTSRVAFFQILQQQLELRDLRVDRAPVSSACAIASSASRAANKVRSSAISCAGSAASGINRKFTR
jgi:hypothetical protein